MAQSSSEPAPSPSSDVPSATVQPNPYSASTTQESRIISTTTTQEPHPPVATTLSVLQPAVTLQGNTAAFTIDSSKSTSIIPFPTASATLRLDPQFDATFMDSNETIAAVASAILLLATVTVVATAGVSVAVCVCCRRRRASSGSRCTGVCVYICVHGC